MVARRRIFASHLEPYFQEHLRRLAAIVPKSEATFAFGVARAVGLDPSLRRRSAVPWLGYDLARAEIVGVHGHVKGEKYTHAGVGVCQGTVDGHRGVVLMMVLFAGP